MEVWPRIAGDSQTRASKSMVGGSSFLSSPPALATDLAAGDGSSEVVAALRWRSSSSVIVHRTRL